MIDAKVSQVKVLVIVERDTFYKHWETVDLPFSKIRHYHIDNQYMSDEYIQRAMEKQDKDAVIIMVSPYLFPLIEQTYALFHYVYFIKETGSNILIENLKSRSRRTSPTRSDCVSNALMYIYADFNKAAIR